MPWYAADRKAGGYPVEVVRQFAIDYYDIDSYKKRDSLQQNRD